MKENWRLREKIRVIDSRETLCFNDFSSWTTSVPLSFFTSWGCLLAELETWGTMREKRSKISRRRREEVRDEEEQPALSWEDHLYREKNKTASFQNEGCVVVTSRDWICLCSISWRIKSQSAYHVQWKNEEEILSSFSLFHPLFFFCIWRQDFFLYSFPSFVRDLFRSRIPFSLLHPSPPSFSSHSLLFSPLHLDPDRYSRSQFESLYPNLSSPSFSSLAVCCSNPFISCREAWMMVNRQGGHLSLPLYLYLTPSQETKNSIVYKESEKMRERKITLPTLGSKWRKEPFIATEVAADDLS